MTKDRDMKALGAWRGMGGAWLLVILWSQMALAADQPLGTVFYSAAERQTLAAARHKPAEEGQEAEAKKSALFTVSGLLQRQAGKSVVWINGQPVAETRTDEGSPPIDLSNGRVLIDGKPVKVGETLDIVSGQRLSPLPTEAVRVKP